MKVSSYERVCLDQDNPIEGHIFMFIGSGVNQIRVSICLKGVIEAI